MSIKGFEVGGVQERYDYTALDNTPANLVQDGNYVHTDNNFTNADKTKLDGIATGANKTIIDATLTQSGQAADAKAAGDEINDLKSAFTANLIHDTATGSIANFPDGAALPVRDLSVDIDPIQDLHGYDNPWPAGGGVNILPPCSINKASDPQITNDGLGSYTINGTATGYGQTVASESFFLDAGTYTLFSNTGASNKLGVQLRSVDGTTTYAASFSADASFTLAERTEVKLRIVFYAETFNTTLSPTLNKGSSVLPFAPYSNICPISGWTGANVTRTGVNVWDEEVERGTISNSTGENTPNNNRLRSKNYISVKSGISYYFKSPANIEKFMYDADKNYLGLLTSDDDAKNVVRTIPNGCAYIRLGIYTAYGTTYNHDISINYPATDTAYHSGADDETYTITFPTSVGAVYGGTLDVTTGKLTVDRAAFDLGNTNWFKDSRDRFQSATPIVTGIKPASSASVAANILCSSYKVISANQTYLQNIGISLDSSGTCHVFDSAYSDAASFKAAVTGQTIVYELATPIVYDLDPVTVETLLGTNNIFADCGDTTVDYYADPTLYINRKIAAAVAAMS